MRVTVTYGRTTIISSDFLVDRTRVLPSLLRRFVGGRTALPKTPSKVAMYHIEGPRKDATFNESREVNKELRNLEGTQGGPFARDY